jgi:hypothetical protein
MYKAGGEFKVVTCYNILNGAASKIAEEMHALLWCIKSPMTRLQSVKVTDLLHPWDTPETCTLDHIRSHYVEHNRERLHCWLEQPTLCTMYLRQQWWVTQCCLLVTYLAALSWTISILLMSDLRQGSHTEQAYSSDGLTNDLHACAFTIMSWNLLIR